MKNKHYVIWDIETLINCSTWCFKDLTTGKKKEFVLFEDDATVGELMSFLKQLKKHDYILVGFNSINFDAQVLEKILSLPILPVKTYIDEIYKHAQFIISLKDDERFKSLIPEWKLSHKHLDVFKQMHYDGKAKMGTSLKWIQFSTNYHNIEEMPISHDTMITKEDIPTILSYNWNDVESTADFFNKIFHQTTLRDTLSEKYNLSLLNASEPRLAKEIFAKFLSEDMDIPKWDLKKLRTEREEINVSDIIFPYVKFSTPELQNVHEKLKKWVIYPNRKQKLEHCFKINNVDTVVALGGIHGCIKSGVYQSTDTHVIKDSDVTSYYPNLAIQNGLRPNHLGESFGKVYNDIFQQRKIIPKSDPINYIFKIILNSTYGLSKEVNSYLYDPLFTFTITINGQLSLLMLAEQLLLRIPNIQILQLNTDGLTYTYDKQYESIVETICEEWCKMTKLELEHANYKKMVIRDVNNYISQDIKNKVKKKGIFETELDYHKNPSFLIIPKALEAYFINGIDYREFILNHNNIYDFCAGIKKKHDFDLNLYTINGNELTKEHQQKVTRYFCALHGGILMKDYKDGRQISIESSQLVQILNTVKDEDYFKNIDYSYYFKEVRKIIETIEEKNQLLLL